MNRVFHRKLSISRTGVGSDSLFSGLPWWAWGVMGVGAIFGWVMTPIQAQTSLFQLPLPMPVQQALGAGVGMFMGYIASGMILLSTTAW